MKAGIIGGGSIGVAFAVVFSRAGWATAVFEPDASRRDLVMQEIRGRLDDLAEFELLEEAPHDIIRRVQVVDSITAAADGADLVQECAPERLDVKRAIFEQLASQAPPQAILASASSALVASQYAPDHPARARCLVAHPGNPPYLIPVIELVPTPFTDAAAVERAELLYRQCGLSPVRVRSEIEGFIFNRLQGAVLREAYCLVRDGVASVEDIDTVVRSGLGLRWSFMGPIETVDLNTRGGIASHAQKMGPAYARMGAERGQNDPWTPDLVSEVDAQRRALLPPDRWADRVRWRDRMLMRLWLGRRSVGPEPWPGPLPGTHPIT